MKHKNFIVFVVVFAFVLLTFGFTFNLSFGMTSFEVRNVGASIMRMISMAFGDFDYQVIG